MFGCDTGAGAGDWLAPADSSKQGTSPEMLRGMSIQGGQLRLEERVRWVSAGRGGGVVGPWCSKGTHQSLDGRMCGVKSQSRMSCSIVMSHWKLQSDIALCWKYFTIGMNCFYKGSAAVVQMLLGLQLSDMARWLDLYIKELRCFGVSTVTAVDKNQHLVAFMCVCKMCNPEPV